MSAVFVGSPRDGEHKVVSGDPPGVLIVGDSGGRYVWRDGRNWWEGFGLRL